MRRVLTMTLLLLGLMPGCEPEERAPSATEEAASSRDWAGDAGVEWSEETDAEGEGQWQGGTMAAPEFPQWSGE